MDEIYEKVFETLFSEFPVSWIYRYDERDHYYEYYDIPSSVIRDNLREVRNYIVFKVSKIKSVRVRSDAKLYLISNYANMVLHPVLLSNRLRDKVFPSTSNSLTIFKTILIRYLRKQKNYRRKRKTRYQVIQL
mgnify:CR=1 FL=1